MTKQAAFFDRDVFTKLVACDLWDETLQALKISTAYRLASATPRSCTKTLKRKGFDGETLSKLEERAEVICSRTETVPAELLKSQEGSELISELSRIDNLDTGEAQITAAALATNISSLVVSGDKRFFSALQQGAPSIYQCLVGEWFLLNVVF